MKKFYIILLIIAILDIAFVLQEDIKVWQCIIVFGLSFIAVVKMATILENNKVLTLRK